MYRSDSAELVDEFAGINHERASYRDHRTIHPSILKFSGRVTMS